MINQKNKKLNPFYVFIFIIPLWVLFLNLVIPILNTDSLKFEGLWRCPFPKTSIEFQSSGRVIISPFFENNKTPSCVTDGTWEKINDNEVKVSIIHNPNCETDDFGGVYKIEDGKNFDGSKTQILTSGIMKFEKK